MKTKKEITAEVRELLIAYEMGRDYKKNNSSTPLLRAMAEIKVDEFIKKQ